jgi:ParB family chromosome partitioning protein
VTARHRGLGRGLAALIPATRGGVDEVDIDLVVPNPEQPRTAFNEDTLGDLVESIREHGVLQPLLVSELPQGGTYQLVAGERRLRAARMAGLERVPVVIKEAASRELLELALVENLQREDLSPLEEAQAYRRLADEFGMTQEAIAGRVGKSRAAVANALRLLGLDGELRNSLVAGEITEGHARALLGIEDASERRRAWRQVVDGGLTVRQTEELVRRWGRAPATSTRAEAQPPPPGREVAAIEERLRNALGTKVEVQRASSGKGRIVVHFYSDEELNGVLQRLGLIEGSSTI